MGLARLLGYTLKPAVIGAVGAIAAKQLGFDISMTEGARQAVIAGLPIAAVLSSKDKDSSALEWAGNHPYLTPIGVGLVGAGIYFAGGACMEWLTKYPINEKFVSGCGGIDGMLCGIVAYMKGKNISSGFPWD